MRDLHMHNLTWRRTNLGQLGAVPMHRASTCPRSLIGTVPKDSFSELLPDGFCVESD